MPAITFQTKPFKIRDWTIIKLPDDASAKLPSRGQTMVRGTINGLDFESPLEPDGRGSHWFKVDRVMQETAKAAAGHPVTLAIESTKDWPEPHVPADIQAAIHKAPADIQKLWHDITPLARWDWIRWIRGTNNPETRKKHIVVALSKMSKGERRPCCFNRSACTDPDVSRGGQLAI